MRLTPASLLCLLAALALHAQQPLKDQYPNLVRALDLTEPQSATLNDQIINYQTYLSTKYDRLSQVNAELLNERLQPNPNPAELGTRYYEIAAICQEATARLATHRANFRTLLTPDQLTRLAKLEANLRILPPIAEIQSLSLIGSTVPDALPPFYYPAGTRLSYRASLSPGEVALPGCPASGLGGIFALIGDFNPAATYPNLIRYLELTGPQLEQLLNLNNQYSSDIGELSQQADTLEREIQAESAQPSPSPSLLGEKAARLEQICRQSLALEAALEQSFPKLLTSTQLTRWQDLERARNLLPVLSESQNIGAISRVAANALPPRFYASTLTRRIEWNVNPNSGPNLPGCQPAAASRLTSGDIR